MVYAFPGFARVARGPLPAPNARRRNAPTIPTRRLPAEGWSGDVPDPPYLLGAAGLAWWSWAWGLPQAAAWDAGALYALGRRAQLEDDLVALADADSLDLAELLGIEDDREALRRVEAVVRKLKALAGGRVSVMREMRELDNRLGLSPKALADLRWTITAADADGKPPVASAGVRRLRAVDARALAG